MAVQAEQRDKKTGLASKMPALSRLGGDGGNRTRVRGTRPQTSTSLVGPYGSPPERRRRPRYIWNQPMGTEAPS